MVLSRIHKDLGVLKLSPNDGHLGKRYSFVPESTSYHLAIHLKFHEEAERLRDHVQKKRVSLFPLEHLVVIEGPHHEGHSFQEEKLHDTYAYNL